MFAIGLVPDRNNFNALGRYLHACPELRLRLMRKSIAHAERIFLQSQRAIHYSPLSLFQAVTVNQLAIDANIAQLQTFNILHYAGLFHILENTVLQAQIENRSLLEPLNIKRIFAFSASQI